MVRNAKSTAFAAVSGYSLRTLKIQVRDVRGDVAPVRTHIRSRSPRIGSEDRGVSGLDGKRMRPVPGLVDARCVRALRAESGPAFRPSADLPSRKAATDARFAACGSARFCTTAVQRGLGVHKRAAHPLEANVEAAPNAVKRRWREEEIALMARSEARLTRELGRCGNVELFNALPELGRTLEAIKGQRRKNEYKDMVQAYLQNAHNIEYPNPSPVSADQIPNDTEQQPQSVEPESPSVERLSTPPSRVDPLEITENPNDEACATNALEDLLERVRKREAYRGRCRRGEYEERQYTDHSNGSRPPNRRKRRRMEYARVQELWKRNPSRVAEEVIDGACRDVKHQLEEMEAYWRPLLERHPFTASEVKQAKVNLKSASGPEGVKPEDWRKVPGKMKAPLFNVWMRQGEVPELLRQCRTIFVPKKEVPAGPSEYRPISIASIPLRHLHTLLARRLLACCPPDVRQRGFICADGTLENAAVLDAVLGDCRKRLRECHVAVLDFSKAFDTVSHVALIDLLRQRGLPGPFCDYLARLYQSATTHLAVNGRTSSPVKVGRGVRQGDPLSPILFNMAMDLVLAALPKEIGYRLEGERVSALAFADDLVLVAGSKMGMQEAIGCVEKSSGLMGLRLNHSKSSVLSMVPDGHRKKHHYLSERTFRMGGRLIRQVTCVERWRYLGVEFEATGSTTLEGGINEALKNISKAPLKPQQRLQILRAHLIPKFLHGLVLGQVRDNRLRMLDVQIRGAVRSWLRLPGDVPNAYFHAAVRDGGLAIPSLRAGIPDLISRRFGRLSSSSWPVAVAASKSERIQNKLRWSKRQLLKYSRDDPFGPSPSVRAYWRQSLHASVDGFELREAGRTPASTKWMRERCHGISGRDFVQFVHTHINALPSRVRNSRGRRVGRESELNCRALCMVRETTAHVIQQCHRTHGGRIERHNAIARLVANAMREKGWSVIEEPKIKTLRGLRKPDLIASKDGTGVIVDAQVVSGRRSLDDSHREKCAKYGSHEEVVSKVAGLLGLPNANAVTATSCTVSWRGIWSPRSHNELSSLLGIDKRSMSEIPVIALRGSHMNWGRFNRMTTVSAVGSADRAFSDQ
ncbi:unnamed protein product [Pieris macdunnoughi]|uniref:Reverse transcriptase domain-containing protein n=1 Tax=Pieris macdunnoughi TaxID=345717 RepID=A0A821XVG3_9NEOP|nr:unnamed protein product [Pieris macdunnoughi]